MRTYGQKGFTLIELITVIVILALLAVFAIPRYLDALKEARRSTLIGVEGALQSAVALVKARAKLEGDERGAAGTVTLEKGLGGTVEVDTTEELVPQATAAGIGTETNLGAIDLRDEADKITATVAAGPPKTVTYTAVGTTEATCKVVYTEAADGTVTIVTTVTDCS